MNPVEIAEAAALGEDVELIFRAESFTKYVRPILERGKAILIYAEIDGLLPGYFAAKIVDKPEEN